MWKDFSVAYARFAPHSLKWILQRAAGYPTSRVASFTVFLGDSSQIIGPLFTIPKWILHEFCGQPGHLVFVFYAEKVGMRERSNGVLEYWSDGYGEL